VRRHRQAFYPPAVLGMIAGYGGTDRRVGRAPGAVVENRLGKIDQSECDCVLHAFPCRAASPRQRGLCGEWVVWGLGLGERFGGNDEAEDGAFAGGQGDFVLGHVAGFHAHHALVFIGAQIGHLLALGDPRIPDHSGL